MVGGGLLFPALTMLWMFLSERMPCLAHKDPCFPPSALRYMCLFNVGTREVEAGGLEGQGHPLIHSTFHTSLGFLKIYLKTNKANKQDAQANQPTWTSCGRDGQSQL